MPTHFPVYYTEPQPVICKMGLPLVVHCFVNSKTKHECGNRVDHGGRCDRLAEGKLQVMRDSMESSDQLPRAKEVSGAPSLSPLD